MSDQIRRPAGHPEGSPAVSQAAWGWIALWAGVATVMGLAAAAFEPVLALGRGAVVFAGVGAACAVALAFAAAMAAAAAALAGWRRLRDPAGSPRPGPRSIAFPSLHRNPTLEELVTGLAAQVAQVDRKLEAVIRGEAARGPREGDARPDPVGESVARAVEQFTQRRDALDARTKAEAENAELRLRTELNALRGAVLPTVNGLNQDVAHMRRALSASETRFERFERRVFDAFRARDEGETLRRLDAEASDLFEALFEADESRYASPNDWRADYSEWRARINRFWDMVRGYQSSVEQPFAVSEADFNRAGDAPDIPLFATHDMRSSYKMLVVVNERHSSFRENAFAFNAEKGKPPEAGAGPPTKSASRPVASAQP